MEGPFSHALCLPEQAGGLTYQHPPSRPTLPIPHDIGSIPPIRITRLGICGVFLDWIMDDACIQLILERKSARSAQNQTAPKYRLP